jgi:hypothetical protein
MDIDELKDLIEWAIKRNIKRIQVGDTSFELSDYAIAANINQAVTAEVLKTANYEAPQSNTTDETQQPEMSKEDTELLFWSSNP